MADTPGWLNRLRRWAQRVKRDALALWIATRHPRTPPLAKALAVFVVAYALSPIDLIPDFIPILGFVDDALLLPALIWLAVRLIPDDVIQTCRDEADKRLQSGQGKPTSIAGAVAIVLIWLGVVAVAWLWWVRRG